MYTGSTKPSAAGSVVHAVTSPSAGVMISVVTTGWAAGDWVTGAVITTGGGSCSGMVRFLTG